MENKYLILLAFILSLQAFGLEENRWVQDYFLTKNGFGCINKKECKTPNFNELEQIITEHKKYTPMRISHLDERSEIVKDIAEELLGLSQNLLEENENSLLGKSLLSRGGEILSDSIVQDLDKMKLLVSEVSPPVLAIQELQGLSKLAKTEKEKKKIFNNFLKYWAFEDGVDHLKFIKESYFDKKFNIQKIKLTMKSQFEFKNCSQKQKTDLLDVLGLITLVPIGKGLSLDKDSDVLKTLYNDEKTILVKCIQTTNAKINFNKKRKVLIVRGNPSQKSVLNAISKK